MTGIHSTHGALAEALIRDHFREFGETVILSGADVSFSPPPVLGNSGLAASPCQSIPVVVPAPDRLCQGGRPVVSFSTEHA